METEDLKDKSNYREAERNIEFVKKIPTESDVVFVSVMNKWKPKKIVELNGRNNICVGVNSEQRKTSIFVLFKINNIIYRFLTKEYKWDWKKPGTSKEQKHKEAIDQWNTLCKDEALPLDRVSEVVCIQKEYGYGDLYRINLQTGLVLSTEMKNNKKKGHRDLPYNSHTSAFLAKYGYKGNLSYNKDTGCIDEPTQDWSVEDQEIIMLADHIKRSFSSSERFIEKEKKIRNLIDSQKEELCRIPMVHVGKDEAVSAYYVDDFEVAPRHMIKKDESIDEAIWDSQIFKVTTLIEK